MALNLSLPGQDHLDLKPRITVFGVGGAGGNAVNNMIEKQLQGVEFVVANTDAQALQQSRADNRIQLGVRVTEGLGAGARPAVGAAAAEETIEDIVDRLAGAHMCFITAGMGGGTGTGAAPIIAQAARELGVLTVGVVTKPFQFEGAKRMRLAEEGIEALQRVVDTLIVIPNQNLFRLANERTTFTEAFALADDVLYQGVKGVTDLMVRPGLINLDFADVRAVMDEMGKAMMGTGEAEGEERAVQAAEKAIANPLLDEISLNGARGVLINITGGYDLTLFELDEAANIIRNKVDADANIIVGSTLDETMEGKMRVSVVATGIDAVAAAEEVPAPRRRMAQPEAAAPTPAPARAAEPTVREEPQPAPREPAFEPAARTGQEPSLFDDIDGDEAGARPDALPEPAYAAATRAEAAIAAARERENRERELREREAAAAGPRSAPGTPSPDTLRRLAEAVNRVPPRGAMQPAARAAAAPATPASATDRARFGINSLINRMAHGLSGEGERERPHGAGYGNSARPQPILRSEPAGERVAERAAEPDPDHERIEIPAFLRRQAN